MENNRLTLAQYFVEQAYPDNKFLEEMNNVIPWWEIACRVQFFAPQLPRNGKILSN